MSADPEFVAFISEIFEPLGPLAAGRFFGGHAFKLDGTQFAMVMGNTLYLKVDDETRPAYRDAGAEAFSYTTKKGRVMVESYYAVHRKPCLTTRTNWWTGRDVQRMLRAKVERVRAYDIRVHKS